MFIRQYYRQKNGKPHGYWAMVESYRTERGPRQRVVSYLGQAEESLIDGKHQSACGRPHQKILFDNIESQYAEIDINRIKVENRLDFGSPWLALELLRRLGLTELFEKLMPAGRKDVPWSLMAMVLIIARLCDCSSDCILPSTFIKTLCLEYGILTDYIEIMLLSNVPKLIFAPCGTNRLS